MLFDQKTITFFKNKIEKERFLELPADGSSMFPLIQKGNICRFVSVIPAKLVKGDIVLFHSTSGQLVAHRFYYRKVNGCNQLYYFKGDTNLGFDQPITEERIIGKLTSIKKADTRIDIKHFPSFLWGRAIISIPALSGWLRRYLNRKHQLQI
ncbi:S24/S26 family peptidase [Neobacillus sp. D3-1R]|uniref:S24/S26 family peptidase n=1 Tax=Neobacillus sp. D3-1R TaxID=3445778 RepID=UPI003F9F30C0